MFVYCLAVEIRDWPLRRRPEDKGLICAVLQIHSDPSLIDGLPFNA